MASPIAIDLTRLFVSVLRGRPRGIERVDLDYTEALLADTSRDVFGIIAYPWGPRVLKRATVEGLAQAVRHIWREDRPLEGDPSLQATRQWLIGGKRTSPRFRRFLSLPLDIAQLVARTGLKRGDGLAALPQGCLYLNVGQIGFAVDRATGWLHQRPDIRVIAFLHDLLPLREPEWFKASSDAYFQKILARILARSQTIILSTRVCADQLRAYAAEQSIALPRLVIQPLVPSPALAYRGPADERLRQVPFFVTTGTIEARKNQLFLLLLWRENILAGRPMPKLVIAGSRGHGGAEAFDLLDRCECIKDQVLEAPGLTSPALMHLLVHSRGLLMPTHAEGFGLPVAEALTLGVPVVASEHPVLAESSQGLAMLINNQDGPSWLRAIETLASKSPAIHPSPMRGFVPACGQDIVALVRRIDEDAERRRSF